MTTAVADDKKEIIKHDEAFDGRPVTKGFDISGRIKTVKQVSQKDLRMINAYAIKPLDATEIAVYEAKLANNVVDRDGERFHEEILQDFADTIAGKSLLMAHQWGPPGVGRFFKGELTMEDGVMWLVASFYLLRDGNEILIKNIDAGIVWAMSIGFIAPDRMIVRDATTGNPKWLEYVRGPNGEKGEAIEGSMVFLGSQFDAAIAKDVQKQVVKRNLEAYEAKHCPTCHKETAVEEIKGVVPYTDYPDMDEATEWDAAKARAQLAAWASSDGSGDKDKMDWAKYARGFAWFDAADKENFGAYKLPHHYVVGGSLKDVWRGVAASMVVVLGGRGGADIPEDDRRGIYNHLARHYKEFDKEPPEYKTYTEAEIKAMEQGLDTPQKSMLTSVSELLDRWFGKGGAVKPPDEYGQCPDGYTMGGDLMCHKKDAADAAKEPAVQAADKGDPDMTQEERNAFKAEIVAEVKAMLAPVSENLAALRTDLDSIKTSVAEGTVKSGEFQAGYKAEIEDIVNAAEKMLERLEAVEALFSAPKGAPDAGKTASADDKKDVWQGSNIVPKEFRGGQA